MDAELESYLLKIESDTYDTKYNILKCGAKIYNELKILNENLSKFMQTVEIVYEDEEPAGTFDIDAITEKKGGDSE